MTIGKTIGLAVHSGRTTIAVGDQLDGAIRPYTVTVDRMVPSSLYVYAPADPKVDPLVAAVECGDLVRDTTGEPTARVTSIAATSPDAANAASRILDRAMGDPIPHYTDRQGVADASLPRSVVHAAPCERESRVAALRAAQAGAHAYQVARDAGSDPRAATLAAAVARSLARGGSGMDAHATRAHDLRHCYQGTRTVRGAAPLSRAVVRWDSTTESAIPRPLASIDTGASPSPSKGDKSRARLRAATVCQAHAAMLDQHADAIRVSRETDRARGRERIATLDALRADYRAAECAADRRTILTRAGMVARAHGMDPRAGRELVRM